MDWFDEAGKLIANIGFPIFIAIYFVVVLKTSVDRNTEAIAKNSEAIAALQRFIEIALLRGKE